MSLTTLTNKRLLAVLFLGFSSGLPLALIGSTLQAWFTEANIDLVMIGSVSLLGIPYTFKFLWAPLMDYFSIPFLGKRRGWILLTQAGLAISLLVLSYMQPEVHTMTMMIIALIVAFFSASQDIAIDAYRTDVLEANERGLGAAYFVFAYRVAVLFSGGLGLVFAHYFGWQVTYQIMAALILVAMIPAYKAPLLPDLKVANNIFQTVTAALQDLLQRERILLLILFIIFYKFGSALAMSLMTTFLLKGLGFTLTEVGLAYKTASFAGAILGAFVGGIILLRWNIYCALLYFGLAQAFSILTLVALAIVGRDFALMTATIFIENFCSGMSTAAFFAFLMSLCNHHYTASQFALLSAIDSIGRVFLGPVAGYMVASFGWTQLYIASFLLCFPGIVLLILLKDKVVAHAHATAN